MKVVSDPLFEDNITIKLSRVELAMLTTYAFKYEVPCHVEDRDKYLLAVSRFLGMFPLEFAMDVYLDSSWQDRIFNDE